MGQDYIFFGRNILLEALESQAVVHEIFVANDSARKWADSVVSRLGRRIPLRSSLPTEVKSANHQGIAFRCNHSFYRDLSKAVFKEHPCVLFTNHVEDPQNFGGLIRAARAFGFTLLVHENRRSAQLNATVMKASAGNAFGMSFIEVSNLVNAAADFRKEGYWLFGLEKSEEATSLYKWESQAPLVLAVGSESDGLTRTLRAQLDGFFFIPILPKVESLNVVQAGTVAMSWVFQRNVN